jgi:hypothetical protein
MVSNKIADKNQSLKNYLLFEVQFSNSAMLISNKIAEVL